MLYIITNDIIFAETLVWLSSNTYISNENDNQITISVISSVATSTEFVIELRTTPSTATGSDIV